METPLTGLIAILILLVLIGVFYVYIRDRLSYYRSLGAEVIGYRYFINPVARLSYKNMNLTLSTEGPRGMHSLVVQVQVDTLGYIKVREREFLDRILFQKRYKNLSLEYEDSAWVNRLFNLLGFEDLMNKLFEDYRISWFEIKGNLLRIGWYIRKKPQEVEGERLFGAINILESLWHTLKGMAPSESYKGDLREWLTFKLPISLTVLLSTVGILGRFYEYDPTCLVNTFFTGYKLLFPFILLYLALCLLLVGGPAITQRMLLKTSFVLLVCASPITLFFLTYVNGRFDNSMVEVKRDVVKSKYLRRGWSPRLTLAKFHKKNPWCESFNVSKGFYNRVQKGSLVEYETKRGFLGVEWLYSGLVLVE